MTAYVVCFVYIKNEAVVLILKKHPAWQKNLLNGPGGKMKPGELPHEAASREFKEEANLFLPPTRWSLDIVMTSTDKEVIVNFLSAEITVDEMREVRSMTDELIFILDLDQRSVKPLEFVPNALWALDFCVNGTMIRPVRVAFLRDPTLDEKGRKSGAPKGVTT